MDDGFAPSVSALKGIVNTGIPALFLLGMCEVLGCCRERDTDISNPSASQYHLWRVLSCREE